MEQDPLPVQARGRSDWHSQVKYDSEIPCVQMDFQFISGFAVWCLEAQAKATVLTIVDMDSGYVGVLMVSGKSPDNFTVRSSSSFVDKLRAAKTRLRYDNEPAMRLLAEKIAAFRHPRTTILEPINRAEHQSVGGDERAEYSSCNTSAEIAHSNQDRRGRCAWTRTFPSGC